jgi:hypothetical protein
MSFSRAKSAQAPSTIDRADHAVGFAFLSDEGGCLDGYPGLLQVSSKDAGSESTATGPTVSTGSLNQELPSTSQKLRL